MSLFSNRYATVLWYATNVAIKGISDEGNLEQQAFENHDSYNASGDSQRDVDEVVVTGVHGSPPDAHADDGKSGNDRFSLSAYYGINGCYEHVGRM